MGVYPTVTNMLYNTQLLLLVTSLGYSSAVIGGHDSTPGQYPWAVSIYLTGNYQCTGVLVAENWVLTSANCPGAINQLASFVEVVAGDYSLTQEDHGEVARGVLQAFQHQDYDSNSNMNTVALLQLASAVELSETIQVATLDQSFTECSLAGWGADETGGSMSQVLQTLNITVEFGDACEGNGWGYNTTGELGCILPPNNTGVGFGACSNDFGSNIVCETPEGPAVSGIVTHFDTALCGDHLFPTIVTNLGYFLQWVSDNIYKDSCHGDHLPDRPHGQWECQVDGGEKVCELVCTPTYENSGGTAVTCEEEGWAPPPNSLSCKEISCPAGYEKINHRCYSDSYTPPHQTWLAALKTCQQDSAELVQFSSKQELDSVSDIFSSGEIWTGANDWYEEGVWRWGFTNIKVKEEVWVNQDSDRQDMNCAFLMEGEMGQGQCSLQKEVLCEKKLGSY